MKKLLLISIIGFFMCISCTKKEQENVSDYNLQDATRQELETAIANRDSLLSLVNEISEGMDKIKYLQNIMSTTGVGGETENQRARILGDIAAIQQTLEKRKLQLDELEKKLKDSNLSNNRLKETIATLRSQIEEQAAEITSLKSSLNAANMEIEKLSTAVDSLHSTVDTITSQRDAAVLKGTQLENELNTCYYVAASAKELKEHKILESGFLRKTKVMESDFDANFFTKADKRTLHSIKLYSKKAKVLTNQPTDSYQIVDNGGQKELRILNPDAFWSLSNYLVVEID